MIGHGERFARVKVPEVLPRQVALPAPNSTRSRWVADWNSWAHLDALFYGMDVPQSYPFLVTRDVDVDLQKKKPPICCARQYGIRRSANSVA